MYEDIVICIMYEEIVICIMYGEIVICIMYEDIVICIMYEEIVICIMGRLEQRRMWLLQGKYKWWSMLDYCAVQIHCTCKTLMVFVSL
jgi:hypothetical protein